MLLFQFQSLILKFADEIILEERKPEATSDVDRKKSLLLSNLKGALFGKQN